MPSSIIESPLHRTEPLQTALIAIAFWALAAMALASLRYLHLWGMPQVEIFVAKATIACCVVLLGLVAARRFVARRTSAPPIPVLRSVGGTPGVLLFAAVASYLVIGTTVLVVEANWQPETAESLRYRVLCLGVLVAAAVGGHALLERVGADKLLRGVLVVLVASCAIILASPVLRELGILAPYRIPFRLTGTFVGPNEAGLVGCMTAALAAALLTNGGTRTLGWLGLAAGVAASLGSASRAALAILVAVALVFLSINVRSRPKVLAWAAAVLAGVAAFAGVVFLSGGPAEWSVLRETSGGKLLCAPSQTDVPGADCDVLLAAKDVLAGDAALNWSRAVPVDRWQGVTVDGRGRVAALHLEGLGLNGRIPAEFGRLDRLVSLVLHRNRLTGPIPAELGNLASLRRLSLSFNALTGSIPPELSGLGNIDELWLRNNRLTGPVPAALGRLGLSVLRLSGNDFHSIPPGLVAVPDHDLDHLFCLPLPPAGSALFDDCARQLAVKDTLTGDRLAGPVPPARFEVLENDLGRPVFCLPLPPAGSALFDDCALLLAVRDTLAGGAELNWSVALPMGEWRGVAVGGPEGRVTALELPRTGLDGRVPAALGHLAGLRSLVLDGNALTGAVPPELGRLAGLETLGLAANDLTGPVPPELAGLPGLRELWLGGNRLTGPLPPGLRALADGEAPCAAAPADNPGLRADCALLLAARDVLAGDAWLNWSEHLPVDDWQGVAVGGPQGRVTALELPRTGLDGRIPPALGRLGRLATLDLSANRLAGTIPAELGGLERLVSLRLERNRLAGPVPPELEGLDGLAHLRLAGNDLDRPFPAALFGVADHDLDAPVHCRAGGGGPGLLADCALLLAARDVLAGDARLNWREDLPIGEWQGVAVGGPEGRVIALSLPRAGLSGRLSAGLGGLDGLVALDLGRNRLAGTIPPELGRLGRLATLDLSANRLAGPVPPELEGLRGLARLRLAGNDLDRPFPAALFGVADHDLGTPVRCRPGRAGPGLLADCALLLAARDVLAGEARLNWREEVPVGFWQGVAVGGPQGRVTALSLPRAGLNGHLSAELGELNGLVALDLGRNRLAGTIPPELGGLERLVSLRLERNRLAGPVPAELGGLRGLAHLRLAGNDLDRPFPAALFGVADHDLGAPVHCRPGRAGPGLLADCALLLAARDVLAGDAWLNWRRDVPVDDWLGVVVDGSRGRVTALELTQTGLNGRIPAELGQLDGLVSLRLDRNRLGGTIPPALGNLAGLRMLALNGNLLAGPVPPELGGLGRLTDLWLHGNRLTGPVPPPVAALPGLAALRIDGDGAAGGPPPSRGRGGVPGRNRLCRSLVALPRLHRDCATLLDVRDELAGDAGLNWSGAVPIGHWRGVTVGVPPDAGEAVAGPRVVALDLSHAGLNGRIPVALSALDGLAVLRLGGNRLAGPIPPELGALTGLRTLVLENNALTGAIPPELGALHALVALRLGGNGLTGRTRHFTALANLRVLALENNILSHGVHPRLGDLSHLEELRLENNRLRGRIPVELDRLTRLAVLRLGGNAFSSCVPAATRTGRVRDSDLESAGLLCEPPPWTKPALFEVGARLMRVRDVLAGDAALNWSYATPVASWEGVHVGPGGGVAPWLDLRDRNLSGRIPPELGELGHLEMLLLDGNRLTGAIPPELGRLTRLSLLSLGGNRLTGPIPPEIGDLPNLRQLWLSGNRLTGSIPPELAGTGLRSLAVAGNDIHGCMPPELQHPGSHDFEGLGSHDFEESFVCSVLADRPLLWRFGLEKAMEAPVFGHGMETLRHMEGSPIIGPHGRPLGPHNLYITLLGEAGVVPLLLFLSAIVLLLRAQWGAPKSLARDATVAWVTVIALSCMTSQHLLKIQAFMFLAGLSIAMGTAASGDGRRPAET